MRTATEVQRETGQPRGARPDYAPAPLTASTDRANGSPWVRHASGHRRRSAPRANRSTPLRPGSIPATESPDAIGVPASLAHLEGSVAGMEDGTGAGVGPGSGRDQTAECLISGFGSPLGSRRSNGATLRGGASVRTWTGSMSRGSGWSTTGAVSPRNVAPFDRLEPSGDPNPE